MNPRIKIHVEENQFLCNALWCGKSYTHTYVKKQIDNDCNNYKLILEGIQKLQSLRLLDVHVSTKKPESIKYIYISVNNIPQ